MARRAVIVPDGGQVPADTSGSLLESYRALQSRIDASEFFGARLFLIAERVLSGPQSKEAVMAYRVAADALYRSYEVTAERFPEIDPEADGMEEYKKHLTRQIDKASRKIDSMRKVQRQVEQATAVETTGEKVDG